MPKAVPKTITDDGLAKDFSYLVNGIDCHIVLFSIFAPVDYATVLEAGCGSGKLGMRYALHARVYVDLIDFDSSAVEYARKLWEMVGRNKIVKKGDISLAQGNVLSLEAADNNYDFVFNEGVPHHWGMNPKDWRRQRCINEMVRVTKPGGATCIIGSNAHCPETLAMARTTEHTYPGMPARQKPFTSGELEERMQLAGLEQVKIAPLSGLTEALTTQSMRGIDFGDFEFPQEYWEASPLIVGWGRKAGK